jgi:hypothetical protein
MLGAYAYSRWANWRLRIKVETNRCENTVNFSPLDADLGQSETIRPNEPSTDITGEDKREQQVRSGDEAASPDEHEFQFWRQPRAAAAAASVVTFFAYGLFMGFVFWAGTDYPYFLCFRK